jgi:hypothetical protein
MAAPKGNKYALGNSGKPPMFSSPEEFATKINEYFEYCTENEENITLTGLALYIGFSSRESLDDYAKKGDEYCYIVKRAKMVAENAYETRGRTIDIFILKNMGYSDHSTMDLTNNGNSFNTLSDAELVSRLNQLLTAGEKK